jgi:hypothetical protein
MDGAQTEKLGNELEVLRGHVWIVGQGLGLDGAHPGRIDRPEHAGPESRWSAHAPQFAKPLRQQKQLGSIGIHGFLRWLPLHSSAGLFEEALEGPAGLA